MNYRIISDAIEYYQFIGYKYFSVPWIVEKEVINITKPASARSFETFMGSLVASGEQSFLQVRNILIDDKRYVCATPCFRDEQEDFLHQIWFFKVELMVPNPLTWTLEQIIQQAKLFFDRYGTTKLIKTDIGTDIYINNIEVGSYGIRHYRDFSWIYGTGVAEPRLSKAIGI